MELLINNQKINLVEAKSFKQRLIGLMGRKNITNGMFFSKTHSIHTFFMKTPIDIIMINKDKKIVYYEKNVKKNRIIIKKDAYHTIELPPNILDKIKINDKLEIF